MPAPLVEVSAAVDLAVGPVPGIAAVAASEVVYFGYEVSSPACFVSPASCLRLGVGLVGRLRWVVRAPLAAGTASEFPVGLVREVPFLLGGFTSSPMHTFRFGGTSHVVESFAHLAIIALLLLTQHYHLYTEVHVEGRWG